MKNLILITLFLASSLSWACEECGFFTYSSLAKHNLFQIRYRYSTYNGYNTLDHTNNFIVSPSNYTNGRLMHIIPDDGKIYLQSQNDFEIFRTAEVVYSHNFKEKWTITAILPYSSNTDYFAEVIPTVGPKTDTTFNVKGFGDLSVTGQRMYELSKGHAQHQLRFGVGISLPTGKYQGRENEGQNFDPSHQPGRGVTHLMLVGNYIGTYFNNWGILGGCMINRSTQRKEVTSIGSTQESNYRFGTLINGFSSVYYIMGSPKFKMIPQLGFEAQNTQMDKLNNQQQINTGGNQFNLLLGTDFKYKDYLLQLLYTQPISQKLNGEQLHFSGRVAISLLYKFGKNEIEQP